MPAADAVTDTPNVPLPPEAGDANAPRFDPNEDWLRRARPDEQKAAMWRWFATRYEEPGHPESARPHDDQGRHVYDDGEAPFQADRVLHERFDGVVPDEVIDDLVRGVRREAGNGWALRGGDQMGS